MAVPVQINLDATAVVAATVSALATGVGGFFAYLVSRAREKNAAKTIREKTAIEYQEALNKSFNALVDQLQEERNNFLAIIDEQTKKIDAQTRTIDKMAAEVHQLKLLLTQNGIEIPSLA